MERALFFFTFRSHQGVKSPYKKEKRDLEKEKIRSPNDAWKDYLKTWGLEPLVARVNVLTQIALWTTDIDRGQQKCLNKALANCGLNVNFWTFRLMPLFYEKESF